MDKHYGWQEGRGSQGQGRPQNGQTWNDRYRGDDRGMQGNRGGEQGGSWQQDERRWTSAGGDLDREDYMREDEEYGGRPRGTFGARQRYGNQGFSGGHYGGFSNEGLPGQGNYGGSRGFSNQGLSNQGYSNQGYTGQRFNQGEQNYGQTFGQGYAGRDSGQGQAGRGFSGRGPKGYQRSDERIKEQLSDRLMDDDDIDASEITIEVKNGEVTLTGTVGSRQEKRAAEDIAEQSPGVREVQNQLRVQSSSSSQSGQFGQSGQSGQSGRSGMSTSGQSKSRNERE